MSPVGVAETGLAIAVAGCIGGYWVLIAASETRRGWALRRLHVRADRAYFAAVEAGEEDPAFAPDVIKHAIWQIVALADRWWRGRTVGALDSRADGPLIKAWARAQQSWLGAALRVTANPSIELIRIVNRSGDVEDRVVARVRIRLRKRRVAFDPFARRHVRLDERWTLGRRDASWVLLSVEGDPLAGPVLAAPLIPTPAYDTERLREESYADLANAQKVPGTVPLSDLVSADAPPAFALLDLSVVDGRFLPALVGGQLAHLVEAWEEAVAGSREPLEALASSEAVGALLRPSSGKRLALHDAVLRSWQPIQLELSRRPPAMAARVQVEAVRYVITDDGMHRAGNDSEPREMTLTWTLELTDAGPTVWRLLRTSNPAEGIPGWSLF